MLVLGYEEYLPPAKRLAEALSCPFKKVDIHPFPDGESKITLPSTLPQNVILVRTLNDPNTKLVELIISAETARNNGAHKVILVSPYLCYMRQDIAFNPGEAVSQKIIGKLLGDYFDAVITIDPHLHRIDTLDQAIPQGQAIALSAAPLMGQLLLKSEALLKSQTRPLLVGPDQESEQWVKQVAAPANLPYVIATKIRHGDRQVDISLPPFAYENYNVVLVDDMISSGHTLIRCAQMLRQKGSQKISALCTHPLLAPEADNALKQAGIDSLISSDSILHSSNQITLAPLIAEAVKSFIR